MAEGPIRLEIDVLTPILDALGSSGGSSGGDTPAAP